MSRIRIAQTGWAFDRPARSVDEVNAGFGLWWVEIVYVDETGEPLPASERVEVDAHLLPPEIVAGTALIRPRRNS